MALHLNLLEIPRRHQSTFRRVSGSTLSAKMTRDSGCFDTVIFNDGEIVSRQHKKAALEGCFALECASRCDEFTADYPADELLSIGEQPQQEDVSIKAEEEEFEFAADFVGAFGKDQSAGATGEKIQTTTPSRNAAATSKLDSSSPRSVTSPKVYEQQQSIIISADEDQVMGLTPFNSRKPIFLEGYSIGDEASSNEISIDVSKDEAAFAAKTLEVGDAAFILRSDLKWTYAVLIDKSDSPDESALRFEVGVDNSRKTFMEAQWGKYVRVIKMSNSDAARNVTTTMEVEDPDLFYYESDSDEETLNDNTNEDDGAVDANLTRPKGILRNKESALDWHIKSSVVERQRSEGNAGYSVKFNMMDEAESTSAHQPSETKTIDDKDRTSVAGEEKGSDETNRVDSFPAMEITFVTQTDNEPVETLQGDDTDEDSSQNRSIDDAKDESKEGSASQTDIGELCQDPIAISSALDCPLGPPNIDKHWDVGQLFINLTQPVYPWPPTESNTDSSQKRAVASAPFQGKEAVEPLAIECELQSTTDVKVHEVYVAPSPPTVIENKADIKVLNSSPAAAFQSASDLSLLKRSALDLHRRKGSVPKTMMSMPTLSKREISFKNKLVANTISRVRSSRKAGRIDIDAINITADTIEVSPEKFA